MKKTNDSGEHLKAKIQGRIAVLEAELKTWRNHLAHFESLEKDVTSLLGDAKATNASPQAPASRDVERNGSLAAMGMTDAVKTILREKNGSPLNGPQIRDALIAGGFNGGKNFYVILTTTLKRLAKKQGVITEQILDGKKSFSATKDLL